MQGPQLMGTGKHHTTWFQPCVCKTPARAIPTMCKNKSVSPIWPKVIAKPRDSRRSADEKTRILSSLLFSGVLSIPGKAAATRRKSWKIAIGKRKACQKEMHVRTKHCSTEDLRIEQICFSTRNPRGLVKPITLWTACRAGDLCFSVPNWGERGVLFQQKQFF